jgi:hypothetical protein
MKRSVERMVGRFYARGVPIPPILPKRTLSRIAGEGRVRVV